MILMGFIFGTMFFYNVGAFSLGVANLGNQVIFGTIVTLSFKNNIKA